MDRTHAPGGHGWGRPVVPGRGHPTTSHGRSAGTAGTPRTSGTAGAAGTSRTALTCGETHPREGVLVLGHGDVPWLAATELLTVGAPVRVGSPVRRHPTALAQQLAVRMSLHGTEGWQAALTGVGRVGLTWVAGRGDDPWQVRTFLRTAVLNGVEQVVVVVPANLTTASDARRVARACERLGVPASVLQVPPTFQEVLGARLDAVRRSGTLSLPHGPGPVALVDARDVAAVMARLLSRPPTEGVRAVTLTGPDRLDGEELAGLVGRHLGRDVRFESRTLLQHRDDVVAELPDVRTTREALLDNLAWRRLRPDPDAADRLLGRRATSVEEYLSEPVVHSGHHELSRPGGASAHALKPEVEVGDARTARFG